MDTKYDNLKKPKPSDYGLPDNPDDYIAEEKEKYLASSYSFAKIWAYIVFGGAIVYTIYAFATHAIINLALLIFGGLPAIVSIGLFPLIIHEGYREDRFKKTETYKKYKEYKNAVEQFEDSQK